MSTFCLNRKDQAVQNLIERVGKDHSAAMAEMVSQGLNVDIPIIESKDNANNIYIQSNLYNDLLSLTNNPIEAFELYINYHSPQYTSKHGKWWEGEFNGQLDENGEPIIDKTSYPNSFMDDLQASDPNAYIDMELDIRTKDETVKDFEDKKKFLVDAFANVGIDVKVEMDMSITSIANVDTRNEKIVVKFNPKLVRKDTLYHEFGHILVDMLGYNNPIIQQGIELLKGTELYNRIYTVYIRRYANKSNLQEAIDKEVLTFAIGLEASKIYDKSQEGLIARFTLWLNRFLDALAAKFGVTRDPIRALANSLIRGNNLLYKLDRSIKVEEQAQMTVDDIDKSTKIIEYLSTKQNDMRKLLKEYSTNKDYSDLVDLAKENYQNLEDSISMLIKSKRMEDLSIALQTTFEFDGKLLIEFERIMDEMQNKYWTINWSTLPFDEQRHLARQLNGIRQFISTFVKIDIATTMPKGKREDLTDIEKGIVDMLDILKSDYSSRISDLRSKYNAVIEKYLEIMLAYNRDPNAKYDAHEILNLSEDITRTQYLFDSLMDVNNPMGSLYKKFYTIHMEKADNESLELERKFYNLLKKHFGLGLNESLNKISKSAMLELFNKFIDEDGRFITKHDYARFNREYKDYIAKVKDIVENENKILEEETGDKISNDAKKKEISKRISKWLKVRLVNKYTDNEIKVLINQKKSSMSYRDFKEWLDNNFYKDRKGKYHAKINSEYVELINEYLDDRYTNLTKDELELYNEIRKMLGDLVEHYRGSIISQGFIPGVAIPGYKAKNKVEKEEDARAFDVEGEEIWSVPFWYTNFIDQKKEVPVPRKLVDETDEEYEARVVDAANVRFKENFTSIDDIREYNQSIREENKKNHAEALERNLAISIPKFIKSAVKHKYKKEIEVDVKLMLSTIKQANFIKLNGWRDVIKDFNIVNNSGEKDPAKYKGAESILYERAKMDAKMVFYELFTEEGRFNEVLRWIQKYNAYKGLGFNPFSALKNVTYGYIMTGIEASAGLFFNNADLLAGQKEYLEGLVSYYADTKRKDNSSTSLQNAIIKRFNVLYSQNELNNEFNGPEASAAYAKQLYRNAAFLMQESGEHLMQQTLLFAMLHSHRLINGKIVSLFDYTNSKLVKVNRFGSKEEAEAAIQKNKDIKKEAKREFESYPKMIDVFELTEDGYADVKEDYRIDDNEIEEFKIKIKGVNHKMHGIYNPSDKGAIENKMMGQLLMQFRHWARPGWTKRFGTRKKDFFNQRRQEMDIGDYRSFFRFLTIPFDKESIRYFTEKEQYTHLEAAKAIVEGYLSYFTRARTYWHSMKEYEKQGVIRTASELASISMIMILLYGLRKIGDDDKDRSVLMNKMINLAMYQADATKTELLTYTPVYGWINEGLKLMANPMATWGSFYGSVKLLNAALMYPVNNIQGNPDDNYFSGGVYNDELKVGIYTGKMVPMLNQIQRIINLESNNRYYKLW